MKRVLAIVMCVLLCFSMIACGEKPTVESYIKSIQSDIDAMIAANEGSGMEMQVVARGNSLVYSYKYTIEIPAENMELVKAALEESMAEVDSSFQQILTALKAEISNAESIIVEYLANDGQVIYSKEYK